MTTPHPAPEPAEECRDTGHTYDVINVRTHDDLADWPVHVVCMTCRAHWGIADDPPEAPAPAPSPYARIHAALDRTVTTGEAIEEGWYLTDFLVIGAAESFAPENKGMSVNFRVGPEDEMPPHRILGLLEYSTARYRHIINQIDDGDD
ncbi:hypothetical protein [Streptomonospora litoralis]|uniref:Uncharacterized protein n=1 Tax=Streptomonospora litoralis TaxID=2498135 RepID=A0A4P6Q7X2_9ACTN|nr:hypothetical protein [Streptomonospora litoralis]QBI56833.1 hypothetical protein EKD16_25465 [Streptomonospora litoralis]